LHSRETADVLVSWGTLIRACWATMENYGKGCNGGRSFITVKRNGPLLTPPPSPHNEKGGVF